MPVVVEVSAVVLLLVPLAAGLWRGSDVEQLAFLALPGVAGFVLLVVVAAVIEGGTARHRAGAGGATATVAVVAAAALSVVSMFESEPLRAAAGLAALLALGAMAARHVADLLPAPTVPDLGAFVALALLAIALALDVADALASDAVDPAPVFDARAPGLAGVAVLAAMSLVERGLRRDQRRAFDDLAGTAQVLLFGLGGVALVAGAAAGDLGLQVSAVALHVLAVVVFLARSAPLLAATSLRDPARWCAAAVLGGAAYIGLLLHLAAGIADQRYVDAAAVPDWLVAGIDLIAFVLLAGAALVGTVRAHTESSRGDDQVAPDAPARWLGRVAPAVFVLVIGGASSVTVLAAAGVPAGVRAGWLAMTLGWLGVCAGLVSDLRPWLKTGATANVGSRVRLPGRH